MLYKPPCLEYTSRGYITPLRGSMAKKKKCKKKVHKNLTGAIPVGAVLTDLVIWSSDSTEEIIRHQANQIAAAIQMSFNLRNFGPNAFGIEEEIE